MANNGKSQRKMGKKIKLPKRKEKFVETKNYENKTKNVEVNLEQDGIVLKLIYEIKEEIGEKIKVN